jgi:hypothetical protein
MTEEKKSDKKINLDILKWVIIGFVGLGSIVLIFGAGMVIGGMKANFSYRWAESYHKNFGGPRSGFMSDWRNIPPMPGDFIEGHGAFGEIIELEDNGFIIRGQGDVEKVIIINTNTVIKKGMKTVEDNLQVGDQVVIIGTPNKDGQIEAALIRFFDEDIKNPPMSFKGMYFPIF